MAKFDEACKYCKQTLLQWNFMNPIRGSTMAKIMMALDATSWGYLLQHMGEGVG